MKPILIDALHINMGGALMILNHLVDHLVKSNVNFLLLKDNRCPKLHSEDDISQVIILEALFTKRYKFYKRHRNDFSSVLCLGNIPPYIKLSVPVHTYSHNVSLLNVPKDYHFKLKLKAYLKKFILKYYSGNTTDWIVQTPNTAQLVNTVLKRKNQQIYEYPFFYIPEKLTHWNNAERKDYIFVGECTHAKGHQYLIEAWVKLHQMGVSPTLHLTTRATVARQWIENALSQGVKIVNHGYVSFDEVIDIYHLCKATIFPSLNESLGLGLVEAMAAGCDVIGCDLPYTHCVCKPSVLFKPQSADSIVEAVLRYESGECSPTIPLIHDKVNEFIDFLNV